MSSSPGDVWPDSASREKLESEISRHDAQVSRLTNDAEWYTTNIDRLQELWMPIDERGKLSFQVTLMVLKGAYKDLMNEVKRRLWRETNLKLELNRLAATTEQNMATIHHLKSESQAHIAERAELSAKLSSLAEKHTAEEQRFQIEISRLDEEARQLTVKKAGSKGEPERISAQVTRKAMQERQIQQRTTEINRPPHTSEWYRAENHRLLAAAEKDTIKIRELRAKTDRQAQEILKATVKIAGLHAMIDCRTKQVKAFLAKQTDLQLQVRRISATADHNRVTIARLTSEAQTNTAERAKLEVNLSRLQAKIDGLSEEAETAWISNQEREYKLSADFCLLKLELERLKAEKVNKVVSTQSQWLRVSNNSLELEHHSERGAIKDRIPPEAGELVGLEEIIGGRIEEEITHMTGVRGPESRGTGEAEAEYECAMAKD